MKKLENDEESVYARKLAVDVAFKTALMKVKEENINKTNQVKKGKTRSVIGNQFKRYEIIEKRKEEVIYKRFKIYLGNNKKEDAFLRRDIDQQISALQRMKDDITKREDIRKRRARFNEVNLALKREKSGLIKGRVFDDYSIPSLPSSKSAVKDVSYSKIMTPSTEAIKPSNEKLPILGKLEKSLSILKSLGVQSKYKCDIEINANQTRNENMNSTLSQVTEVYLPQSKFPSKHKLTSNKESESYRATKNQTANGSPRTFLTSIPEKTNFAAKRGSLAERRLEINMPCQYNPMIYDRNVNARLANRHENLMREWNRWKEEQTIRPQKVSRVEFTPKNVNRNKYVTELKHLKASHEKRREMLRKCPLNFPIISSKAELPQTGPYRSPNITGLFDNERLYRNKVVQPRTLWSESSKTLLPSLCSNFASGQIQTRADSFWCTNEDLKPGKLAISSGQQPKNAARFLSTSNQYALRKNVVIYQ